MTDKINFTIASLEKLQPPTNKSRSYYYDTQVNGLCVSVTKAGIKSFLVYKKLKGRPIRVTLGRVADLKIEQARTLAKKAISDLAHGVDPIKEKRAERARSATLQEVFDDYMQSRDEKLSANTKSNYKTVMNNHLKGWLDTPMSKITRDMVERKHAKLSEHSDTAAN